MSFKLGIPGLALATVLTAQSPIGPVSVSKTENVELPAGGTLRLEKSIGELTIEGWDQTGVEIATTRITKDLYPASDRDKELKVLDQVRVSSKVNGKEVVVTTEYPHHKAFPWISPVSDTTNFDLEYRIKVPRNATIILKHDAGEVHLIDVTGNIQATDSRGLITVSLSGDAPRVVDARSRIGSVSSEFSQAVSPHPWPFGHNTLQAGSASEQNLKLRIGFGDIIVRKAYQAEPTPKSPDLPSGN